MPFDKNGKWVLDEEAQAIVDNDVGFWDEIGRGITSGALDAAEETLQFGKSAIDTAIEFTGYEGFEDTRKPIITYKPNRPRTMGGKVVEDLTQFGLGFVGAGKIKAVGKLGRGLDHLLMGKGWSRNIRQGAVGDTIVSNPYEERLSNVLEDVPALDNVVTQYLAADPEDSFAEGKFKAGIEGALTGAAVEAVFKVGKAFKRTERAIDAGEDITESVAKQDLEIDAAVKLDAEEVATENAITQALKSDLIAEQKAKGTTNTPQTILDDGLEEVGEAVVPELSATKELIRRKLDEGLKNKTKDELIKATSKKELVGYAEMLGIKLSSKNSRTKAKLLDTVVDDLYKGVDVPKAKNTVKIETKVSDKGVKAPTKVKIKKLDAAQIKNIAKNPEDLGDSLKKGNLYDPKTWDPTNPAGVKDTVSNLIKVNAKEFQAVRGTQSWKDAEDDIAERFGDMFGLKNEEIAGIVTNFTKATEDASFVLGAAESVVKKQYEDLYDSLLDVRFNTEDAFTQTTLEALESSSMLLKSLQGQETAFGRALNLRKKPVMDADQLKMKSLERDEIVELEHVLKAYGGKKGLEQLRASFVAAGRGNFKAMNKVIKATQESNATKGMRSVVELFRSMILLNTKTHVTNMLSGGMETFLRPMEGYVGSFMGKGAFSAEAAAARSYYSAQVEGLFMGLDAAIVQSSRAFQLEKNLLDTVGKVDDITQANKITSEYWDVASDTFLGGFLNYTGKASRMSLRALGAEDEFFKQINYRSAVYAASKLEGAGRGLKGEELSTFISKNLDDAFDASGAAATANGKFKHSQAVDMARRVTFTQELRKGSHAQKLHSFVASNPSFQMVLPFVRTPTNLITSAVQRTPMLSKLSKDLQEQLNSTDMVVRSQAQGKLATGMVIYGGALSLVYKGLVTGAGPSDPAQNRTWRQAGNQPYSIKVGGKWVSYQRMDPNFMPIAAVANMYDSVSYSPAFSGDVKDIANVPVSDLAVSMILGITKTVEDKAYFQGISNLIAALTSENPAQKNSLRRIGEQYVTSFVPAAPEQIYEGVQYMMDGQPEEMKEAVGLVDKIRRRWVTSNDELPTKYNWLTGKPMINYGGFSGLPVVDATEDKVLEELVSLKVGFRGPTKTMSDLKFKLNTEEFAAYQRLAGTTKINGRNLMGNLEKLFASEAYSAAASDFELTAEGFNKQADLTRKVISAHIQSARAELIQEFPELRDEYVARKVAKQTGQQLLDFNR